MSSLYAASERGEVAHMTGVADPYEPPFEPDIRLSTVGRTAHENAALVIAWLDERERLSGTDA